MKIAHFLTDLVAALTGRLFFLMIKAQPEGQCSDIRHWYEHISLTFILTAEAKYCSPKCKSIKKKHIRVFYYSSGRGFWLIFAIITLSLLIKYVLKVQFKDLFFFCHFAFLFLYHAALDCSSISPCESIHPSCLDSRFSSSASLIFSPASCVFCSRIVKTCRGARHCAQSILRFQTKPRRLTLHSDRR